MKLDNSAKFVFLYSLNQTTSDVWTFAEGRYHRFTVIDGWFRYIRSQDFLPEGTIGQCYGVNWAGYQDTEREASNHNVLVHFYDDILSCEQGEVLELHPVIIYGLSKPAGTFWQEDEIDKGDGDESRNAN